MEYDVLIGKSGVYINGERAKFLIYHSRKTYVTKDLVVKIEWEENRNDIWQCKKEHSLWNKFQKSDREFFIPVLDYFSCEKYDYVVQPRYKIYKLRRDTDKIHKAWKNIIEPISEKYEIWADLCEECLNWGFLNRKYPIIIDYGV